ncbi:ABC transporter permease [Paraflavitalea soli]|uniref:ABC transporter permease n=1 Tax=Paraflavitalea soli TaxID=2315862 RepID=A0A3B7MKA2_9BACT|nr:ABC transporter permease [Paraflavitalea soli]AXY74884.1 ABC transporter permease [Paraflavitalea soli]
MIKNYFKTAFRSLLRNKSYAAINITGLTVGIAACLLIYLITSYHLSFDNFHTRKDRIYRVVSESIGTGTGTSRSAGVPIPTAKGLRNDFPELQGKVAGIFGSGNDQITVLDEQNRPGKKFKEARGLYFAESQFFDIFDYKWLAGDPKTALADPNNVVLTRDIAEKYFGDWHAAMGRAIKYENADVWKVTGILENLPPNTDFPLQIVAPFKAYSNSKSDDWVSIYSSNQVYIALPENYASSRLSALLPGFVKKHKPAENATDGMALQPLTEMHFDTRFNVFSRQVFSKELITALSLIGLFLLIIACVNFINLATAQAVNRAKEVGVRKVLGSSRKNLITQFMSETLLITLFAVVLATGLAWIVLPSLNTLLQTRISANFFNNLKIPAFLLVITLLVTLLAGFYPALVLSGYNPITALKSKLAAKTGSLSLRRALVVFQFAIAQVLVIGMLVVVSQMNFFKNASLGFTKDHILSVPIPGDSAGRAKIDYLRAQLLQQPGISDVSFSFGSPAENGNWSSDFNFDNATKSCGFEANLKWVDVEHFKTFDLQFVAGRPFYPSDTIREFVVSEILVKKLGLKSPQDIIGKKINLWGGEHVATVCGVIKDFHTLSLRQPLDPIIMAPMRSNYQMFSAKIRPEKAKETLAYVEKLWTSAYPDFVYEYQFLDEKIDRFYRRESQLSQLYTIFAGIAIFISCLGLYGLVSFMATQRVKEVGIRKVLGASVANIVYLFSREFTVLILISFLIAAPLAWYIMSQWLGDFEYRIQLGAGIFLLAIAGSVFIAWITVGYRAIRAALTNPVKSLKNE